MFGWVPDVQQVPEGWVRQNSPTSQCTIACPKSWPQGEAGAIGAVWVTSPFWRDGVVALRRFKRDKPPFDLSNCTTSEFTSIALPYPPTILNGLNVYKLEYDFEMDGKEAVWGKYSAITAENRKLYGFSAVTWDDGVLYMLNVEHENPWLDSRYVTLIDVARLADLK